MSLLLADMFRRAAAWPVFLLMGMLTMAWLVIGLEQQPVQAMALSLAAAFAMGPICTPILALTPLTPYLPVSRRDRWRAIWLMAAIVAPAVTAVLMLPAALAAGTAGWSLLSVSTIMAFAYAGTGCALLAFGGIAYTGQFAPRGDRRWLARLVSLLFLGGPLWSYAFLSALPARWSDLTPRSVSVLLVGLGCTAAAYFHTPPFASRGRWRLRTAAARPSTIASPVAALSGMPRLLAHELTFVAVETAGTVCAVVAVGLVASAYAGSIKTIGEFANRQVLLVFSPVAVRSAVRDFDVLDQLVWYALLASSVSPRFPGLLRHLRVLPVSTARLHGMLLGWPVLYWGLVWSLVAVIRFAVTGQGLPAVRVDLLVFLVALTALGQALTLRFQSMWVRSFSGMPMIVPLVGLAYKDLAPVLLAAAAILIATAVAVNRNAFSRGETYRRVPLGRARTESI